MPLPIQNKVSTTISGEVAGHHESVTDELQIRDSVHDAQCQREQNVGPCKSNKSIASRKSLDTRSSMSLASKSTGSVRQGKHKVKKELKVKGPIAPSPYQGSHISHKREYPPAHDCLTPKDDDEEDDGFGWCPLF